MTVLILAETCLFGDAIRTLDAGNRRPLGLGELNLVNDARGYHRLGDAPTSHATDASRMGTWDHRVPLAPSRSGSLRFGIRKSDRPKSGSRSGRELCELGMVFGTWARL